MQFTASFDREGDARRAATALIEEGFTLAGIRRSGRRWVLKGARLVSTEEELENADDRLAEHVLDNNGAADAELDRLEVESLELAGAFRAADARRQERVTKQMVERALLVQEPPLVLAGDRAVLDGLLAELDASGDEADFRRARAVAATVFLREAAHEDALYEALHAHRDIAGAVQVALSALS
jgi:hypothetical protein